MCWGDIGFIPPPPPCCRVSASELYLDTARERSTDLQAQPSSCKLRLFPTIPSPAGCHPAVGWEGLREAACAGRARRASGPCAWVSISPLGQRCIGRSPIPLHQRRLPLRFSHRPQPEGASVGPHLAHTQSQAALPVLVAREPRALIRLREKQRRPFPFGDNIHLSAVPKAREGNPWEGQLGLHIVGCHQTEPLGLLPPQRGRGSS